MIQALVSAQRLQAIVYYRPSEIVTQTKRALSNDSYRLRYHDALETAATKGVCPYLCQTSGQLDASETIATVKCTWPDFLQDTPLLKRYFPQPTAVSEGTVLNLCDTSRDKYFFKNVISEAHVPDLLKRTVGLERNAQQVFAAAESASAQLPNARCYVHALDSTVAEPVGPYFLDALWNCYRFQRAQVPEQLGSNTYPPARKYCGETVKLVFDVKLKALFYIDGLYITGVKYTRTYLF